MEPNSGEPPKRDRSPLRVYNTTQQDAKLRACVYCEDISHKSSDCPIMTTFDDGKSFLHTKGFASTELCLSTGQLNV